MNRGKIIVISGPSGVGKGTIRDYLFAHYNQNFAYSISMTTRKKRPTEVDGKDYYFVSVERFKEAIANNELLEWAEFVSNYYGTPTAYVDHLLDQGKNVILEIEIMGALQVLAKRPDSLSIFIAPPSIEVLEQRIRSRNTETDEFIKYRIKKALNEMKYTNNYRHVIINHTVEEAAREISSIIKRYLED